MRHNFSIILFVTNKVGNLFLRGDLLRRRGDRLLDLRRLDISSPLPMITKRFGIINLFERNKINNTIIKFYDITNNIRYDVKFY